ncbi:MAG TPA: class I SAM-dependent methyltransferase, partial [Coriobacteriia bacterium]|nr:class I SAM-dependent methyltransferase [Coriobacteriia bacterium]
ESAIARRERLAAMYDIEFGKERVFPELLDVLLAEVPEGVDVLEVGAATGYLTRPLLERAGRLTALEPSAGMLRVLVSSQVAGSAKLSTRQGMVEDLDPDDIYDVAVVTFTPRRGPGLFRLLIELATRVRDRVVMLLDEEGTLDWAYLARAVAKHGLGVRLQIVCGQSSGPNAAPQRAVVFVVEVARVCPISGPAAGQDLAAWSVDARRIEVPHPPPRGTATRLVRYVLARGDQAVVVETDAQGVERLHGNLRTAVHRIARDRLTVRRDGDLIQIMRLPRGHEEPLA